MQQDFQVIFIVVIGSLLLILLVAFIVLSVFYYQRSQLRNSKAMEDLKNSVQKEMLVAQLEIKENTLNTIAQEIHDNIGQVLSLAKLNLTKVVITDSVSEAEKINTSRDLIGKAIQDLRNLSKTLNTNYIGEHRLSELIRTDIDMIEKVGDYKINLHLAGDENLLGSQYQLIVYRIMQEALTNIIKHAQGSKVEISLRYLPSSLHLVISDNGIGFDVKKFLSQNEGRGSGIYNMEHRTRLIGGTFLYESIPGEGTVLTVVLPLNPAA